jgi:hypothetical protein
MFFRLLLLSFATTALSAPLSLFKRADPCFVTGSVALPAEVSAGIPALEAAVTCNPKASHFPSTICPLIIAQIQVATGVPDIISGGIAYSTIDFQKSSLSPVGFALYVSARNRAAKPKSSISGRPSRLQRTRPRLILPPCKISSTHTWH